MRIARMVIAVLLVALVAGPTLLDRCLVNCHEQSSATSAVPSCHDTGAPHDGLSLRGVSACDHDHDAMVADASVDSRVSAASQMSAPAVLAAMVRSTVGRPAAPTKARSGDAGHLARPPASRSVPLRV